MPSRRKKPTVMQSVARGAAAGLAGGAALVVAHRVVLPRLPDRQKKTRIDPLDQRVARAADRVGLELSPRARTAIAVSTQLACATLLGALYAVVTEQMEPSQAADDFIHAGTVFVASLVAPELQKKRRKLQGLPERMGHAAMSRITAPSLFGRATSLALRAMR